MISDSILLRALTVESHRVLEGRISTRLSPISLKFLLAVGLLFLSIIFREVA